MTNEEIYKQVVNSDDYAFDYECLLIMDLARQDEREKMQAEIEALKALVNRLDEGGNYLPELEAAKRILNQNQVK